MSLENGEAIIYFVTPQESALELDERLRRLGNSLPYGRLGKIALQPEGSLCKFSVKAEGFVAIQAVAQELICWKATLSKRAAERKEINAFLAERKGANVYISEQDELDKANIKLPEASKNWGKVKAFGVLDVSGAASGAKLSDAPDDERQCGTCGHRKVEHFTDVGTAKYCCDGCNDFSYKSFYEASASPIVLHMPPTEPEHFSEPRTKALCQQGYAGQVCVKGSGHEGLHVAANGAIIIL